MEHRLKVTITALSRNRVLFAFDLLGWTIIPVVALALRFDDFANTERYAAHLAAFAVVCIVCKFGALWTCGLYQRYWRYASVQELGLISVAVLAAGASAAFLYFVAVSKVVAGDLLPRSIPILDTLLTLMWTGGTRYAVRFVHRLGQQRQGYASSERVLIVGAGDAGTMVVKELEANPQLGLEPVAFIDDDPLKQRRLVMGLRVVGGRERIQSAAREYKVRAVIIAMPKVAGREIRSIHQMCEAAGLRTKVIPGVYEIISGRVGITQLRDVQIEDLLRRPPVETDQAAAAQLVAGRTVLVTGAGGSIGSEICRQVARLGAARIVLLGHGENCIYEIDNELNARYPQLRSEGIIADIRDANRLDRVFQRFRPDVVFHAAAHKHVPLMELNPEESITNNIGGTQVVLEASERVGVERFVFISTDKAVNPVSLMGASKLVAEMIVHDVASRTGRPYVSVRFGNVLASNGSVVPLFRHQIAAGGPLTVTHPDIVRYFMTIPEAVQLVLQAAVFGHGGETFVLDMGDPVRIVDLAKDLVELSGLEVGRDIDIVYTGLRPGEKMCEELFASDEPRRVTQHHKIFVARNGVERRTLRSNCISRLLAAARGGNLDEVERLLGELLPSYRKKRGSGPLDDEDGTPVRGVLTHADGGGRA